MPFSPGSSPFQQFVWKMHFARLTPNFPEGTSDSIATLCGTVVSPLQLTREASAVQCELCRAKLDNSVTVRLTEPEIRRTIYCPKCGSSDYTDASQSYDCNECGHSW